MQVTDLSGTIILPEIVEACLDILKAPKSSVVYGMTEGNGIVGSNIQRAPFVKNSVPSIVPCGTAMPGGRLKVCMPGTRTALNRNEVGELDMGGLQAVSGYLDRESTDFYTDGGVNWIVTGDQAKIDDNGMLYILGRYKDIIIRGGTNLSPAIIERCLDSLTGIKDTQFACSDSPNTTAALKFHLDRLKGWQDHRDALWPPQRSPQFFRGSSDSQWTHIDGTAGKPHEREPLDAHPCGAAGVKASVTIPSLPAVKSTNGITAQNIFKAALAILIVHRTHADQAFFGQAEAARVWPTEKGDPDPDLPNTMDIAGPTFEIVVNRIHVNPAQHLLVFLRDLQEEQKLLSAYAQAPWKKLESLLRRPNESEQGYELHDTVFCRQTYNWLPNTRVAAQDSERTTRELQSLSRAAI
ncbi:MAG: hypothetical protein Q9228_005761, partial [Teloschistes exilis]